MKYLIALLILAGCQAPPVGSHSQALHITYIAPGTTVTVGEGESIVLDDESLVVEGTLVLESADQSNPAVVRFENVDESAFLGGDTGDSSTDPGLWIQGSGKLIVRGQRVSPYVNLADSADATDTVITLRDEPIGWEVGGRVAIAPTVTTATASYWAAWDERTITAISGASVTLDSGLTYDHPSTTALDGTTWTAEVLYLERSVVIEGTSSGHAHVHINSDAVSEIAYGAFRRLGVDGVLGRYALHWHGTGADSRGTLVEGALVETARNHGVVPHESHGITIQNSVVYDINTDAYWWDLGDQSNDIKLVGNVAAKVSDPSVWQLAGFVLGRGTGNIAVNNIAVGIDSKGLKESGFSWHEQAAAYPNAWGFLGNIAHNIRGNGVWVWHNGTVLHQVHSFGGYAFGVAAVDHGAYRNVYSYTSVTATDASKGFELFANSGDPQAEMVSIFIDASDYGMTVAHAAALTASNPVLIRNCELSGSQNKIHINATFGVARLVDWVECNIAQTDVTFTAAPIGSVFRFQDGASAWQMDDQGNTSSISTFWP